MQPQETNPASKEEPAENLTPSKAPPKPMTADEKKGCGCIILILLALCFLLNKCACSGDRAREARRQELSGSYEGKVQFIIEDSFPKLDLCEVSSQIDGGYAVHVKWKMEPSWSNGTARKAIFMRLHTFLSSASKNEDLKQVVRYWFDPQVEAVDKYGAQSVETAAKIIIPRETINRIQWGDFDWRMLMDLCESEGMVTWRPVILDRG